MFVPNYSLLIGKYVERLFDQEFESFVRMSDDMSWKKTGRIPDFLSNDYYVELKAGFRTYGPHVHNSQFGCIESSETIYAFAFHNKKGAVVASKKYRSAHSFIRYFLHDLRVEMLFFVSSSIVEKIYEKQKGKPPRSSRRDSDLVMKESLLWNVYHDRTFKRGGQETDSRAYYGVDPDRCIRKHLGQKSEYFGDIYVLLEQKDASFQELVRPDSARPCTNP